jgi:type VI secretion system secreted protein VgrG
MSSINKKFSFTSSALPDDTFDVVSFSGSEGLSKLYRFDVTLVADNDEIDLENIIQSRATLNILREDGDITFHGILSSFEELETVQERTHYRAVLTPAFWRETLTFHNQIFLDKTIPQIIEAAMQDGGLTSLEYEFRLTGQYLPHEYVCQYNESHYSFVSRLMEREGIYYYFEQGETSEKVIITDTALLHSVMEEGEKMYYSPPSGLDQFSREEVIKSLVCCQKMLPARVVLKDYNYRKPSLELTVEATVSEKGLGDVYIYGEHFPTPEEGQRLAQIRAEQLKCQARTFQGESLIPYLRPGYIFLLEGHNRKNFNLSYLTTDITHQGDQSFLLAAGLDEILSDHEKSPYYRNSFTAISSEIQFRPERTTEKPRFAGTMHAHIDAAGSGQYAEIDEQGRYKVRLPFDLNSPTGGKASSWIRMAQPYAGDTHGMHFPLHKGTEVLLTCIDGDIDRLIISAAVPNPLTPSPVTSANATQSRITTAGGNKLHIEDQKGGERILLHTPNQNTWIRMGAQNAPATSLSGSQTDTEAEITKLNTEVAALKTEVDGMKISTVGTFELESTTYNTITMGEEMNLMLGSSYSAQLGTETNVMVGASVDAFLGLQVEASLASHVEWYEGTWYTSCSSNELVGRTSVEIKAGGVSGPLDIITAAVLALAAADSIAVGLVAGLDTKLEEDQKEKNYFDGFSDSAYAVALGLVGLAIKLSKAVVFPSEIILDALQIKMESPGIKMEALATGIEMTAVLGGIKATADAGGITNKALLGGITNTAVAGGITNKAAAGGITNTADVGNITNTATAGKISNTAGTGISNIATTGTFNNIAKMGALNNIVEAGDLKNNAKTGAITNQGVTNTVKGTTSVLVTGPQVKVSGTASVMICGGGYIKLQ